MQVAKEKLSNLASSAKEHINIYKAKVAEKVVNHESSSFICTGETQTLVHGALQWVFHMSTEFRIVRRDKTTGSFENRRDLPDIKI
ncbi:hypothetical protein ACLB2K_052622 [Fragaria x ananassa]